jgi:GNAT superfamily N-acetyltransferase
VAKPFRRQGVSTQLVSAAVDFAQSQGATVVEGYPYDYRHRKKPAAPPFVWTGLFQSFERAGFHEVARPSDVRVIMRREI